jgi:rod shape-determining protein MreC
MLVRTGRQGVARGSGNDSGSLDLDYVPLPAEVRAGERVLTAGIDGIYPRGIPLGAVVSVAAGGQLFHKIRLTPAADFGSLVRVYLLESTVLPEEVRKDLKDARH